MLQLTVAGQQIFTHHWCPAYPTAHRSPCWQLHDGSQSWGTWWARGWNCPLPGNKQFRFLLALPCIELHMSIRACQARPCSGTPSTEASSHTYQGNEGSRVSTEIKERKSRIQATKVSTTKLVECRTEGGQHAVHILPSRRAFSCHTLGQSRCVWKEGHNRWTRKWLCQWGRHYGRAWPNGQG